LGVDSRGVSEIIDRCCVEHCAAKKSPYQSAQPYQTAGSATVHRCTISINVSRSHKKKSTLKTAYYHPILVDTAQASWALVYLYVMGASGLSNVDSGEIDGLKCRIIVEPVR